MGRSFMKKNWFRRLLPLAVFAVVAVSAYFINVEVQSCLGRRALEITRLASLPLEEALIKAKSEKKLVMVDVSAIWCPTCRRLDIEIFGREDVARVIGEKYVFTRLEYESQEGQQFLEKYEASGFPSLFLLDGDGKLIKRLRVTFDAGEFIRQLNH